MGTLNVLNITNGTDTVATGYAINGSAKSWVNFNGTGTIAARDSLNVSSLADNGSGNFNISYTTSFNAVDYSISGNQTSPANEPGFIYMIQPRNTGTVLTGLCGVYAKYVGSSAGIGDYAFNTFTAHGELA